MEMANVCRIDGFVDGGDISDCLKDTFGIVYASADTSLSDNLSDRFRYAYAAYSHLHASNNLGFLLFLLGRHVDCPG